jgi:aspartate kinase
MSLVMKFGGTSVADAAAISRVVDIVSRERDRRGYTPVVVVSAMSGVTDQLLVLSRHAAAGDRDASEHGWEELRAKHLHALQGLAPHRSDVRQAVEDDLEQLRATLAAACILREASPRAADAIAACGELISSRIVAAAFEDAAVWVDPRRVMATDGTHGAATPLMDGLRDGAEQELVPVLERGLIAVTGGYVGSAPDAATTTLGRGGSDYSAALIAAALHDLRSTDGTDLPRTEIQIWTDVDGMLTADPRVVADARCVPQLSFGEASELAYFGAKVLHPSTILPAVDRDIPVRILNSRRPDGAGTVIVSRPSRRDEPLAAIACKRNITVVEITSTRMLMAHGFLRRLFEVFERHRTAVDVVTTSEVSVSVTVDDDRSVGAIAAELSSVGQVNVEPGMAILCTVGDGLQQDPCAAVRVLASLEGLPLRIVSQSSSRRNVTVVLDEANLAPAMRRLHAAWFGASNTPMDAIA